MSTSFQQSFCTEALTPDKIFIYNAIKQFDLFITTHNNNTVKIVKYKIEIFITLILFI